MSKWYTSSEIVIVNLNRWQSTQFTQPYSQITSPYFMIDDISVDEFNQIYLEAASLQKLKLTGNIVLSAKWAIQEIH